MDIGPRLLERSALVSRRHRSTLPAPSAASRRRRPSGWWSTASAAGTDPAGVMPQLFSAELDSLAELIQEGFTHPLVVDSTAEWFQATSNHPLADAQPGLTHRVCERRCNPGPDRTAHHRTGARNHLD